MIGISDIQAYASMVPSFTCKQMLDYFNKTNKPYSTNTTASCIRRLQNKGIIEKICHGTYKLSSQSSATFKPLCHNKLKELASKIHDKFPLIRFCAWSLEDLKRFSHYVINMNILFIDVERGCEESVFYFLQSLDLTEQVYFKPNAEEYSRYIRNKPTIVVRTLISEAPLSGTINGINQTTIEKILVDSIIDEDFQSFQQFESLRIFKNAFESCSINKKKMLRYASRRNHKDEIENLLKEINKNAVFD